MKASTTVDRRVTRTRATLQEGLCALLRRKHYEAITIGDICAAANVGRSTFYAHYKSKDDLKRSGLERLHAALAERQQAARVSSREDCKRNFGFSLSVFAHARDHLDHYRTLAGGRGSAVALAKLRQMVTDLVRRELSLIEPEDSGDARAREVVVQFVAGAFVALLIWWLDSGAKLLPEQIDAIFKQLVTRGLASDPLLLV